eukprot:5658734-Amphidinium_carterae.1
MADHSKNVHLIRTLTVVQSWKGGPHPDSCSRSLAAMLLGQHKRLRERYASQFRRQSAAGYSPPSIYHSRL